MRRELRVLLVAALVAVLVIDPATACHYYGYYRGYSRRCVSYCPPVRCCAPCGCEVVVRGPCGCEGEVVREGPPSDAAPRETYEPGRQQPMTQPAPADVRRPVDTMPRPQLPLEAPAEADRQPPDAREIEPSRVEPMPREEPPAATPSADELFGPPPEPAEEPSGELFGPLEEPTTPPAEEPSEPSSNELFGPLGEPPAEPEPTEEPMSEPAVEEFFGPPLEDTTPPVEEVPVEEEEEQPTPAEEDDGLFDGFGAILHEPGGFASAQLRKWVDNTGRYSCRGRLVRILDGKVQLLKDNGRTTTVPFGRLSQSDVEFVHRQASAQRAEAFGQTAQVGPLRATQ